MLDGVPDGEYADQGSVWTGFDLGKSCVGQIEKGKALQHTATDSGLVLNPVVGDPV